MFDLHSENLAGLSRAVRGRYS